MTITVVVLITASGIDNRRRRRRRIGGKLGLMAARQSNVSKLAKPWRGLFAGYHHVFSGGFDGRCLFYLSHAQPIRANNESTSEDVMVRSGRVIKAWGISAMSYSQF